MSEQVETSGTVSNPAEEKTLKNTIHVSEPLLEEFVKRLGRDILRYLPAAFLPAGLSVLGVAIFTRIFDPREFGQYALVAAAAAIMITLVAAWIQQSVLRYLPKFREQHELPNFMQRFCFTLSMTLLIALIAFLILYLFLNESLDEYGRFYFPGVLLVLAGIAFQNLSTVFQANLQSGKFAKYKISQAVGRLALALALIFLISRDVVWIIVGTAAAQMILVVLIAVELDLGKAIARIHRSLDLDFFKTFAAYGFPLIGWMMGGQILGLSDRFIIGSYKGASQVGIYSANYMLISMGLGLASSPFIMAAHPIIMNAWERGSRARITELISAFSRYYLLAIIPLVLIGGIFSRELVMVLLGAEFHEGHIIIPFVLAGYMVWGLSMYGHKGLELLEKTLVMLMLVGVCAVTNIILNLIFVPKYGYFAAAVTTFISYLVYPILVHRISRAHIPWRIPWKAVGRIAIASAVTGSVVVVLRTYLVATIGPFASLVFGGIAALVVYFAVLWATREIGRSASDD